MVYLKPNGLKVNFQTNRRILCQKEKELMGLKEEDQLKKIK